MKQQGRVKRAIYCVTPPLDCSISKQTLSNVSV